MPKARVHKSNKEAVKKQKYYHGRAKELTKGSRTAGKIGKAIDDILKPLW